MLRAFESDPAVKSRFQFWTFGYSTGEPIPYSAELLRQALADARRRLDPEARDPALERMIVVGHSMGGILAKMLAQESGARLWSTVSDRPVAHLAGAESDRAVLRASYFYKPQPFVRRVVFIATPHRGSPIDRGVVHELGTRLARRQGRFHEVHRNLLSSNEPGYFGPAFRGASSTSVDQLTWDHPVLAALGEQSIRPDVPFHSIIADFRSPPQSGGTDGIVPYASAHLDGAASELVVNAGHICIDTAPVIQEVRRILLESEKASLRPLARSDAAGG
jgi:pimeloyl-ACP methyl ester carboxylesterase